MKERFNITCRVRQIHRHRACEAIPTRTVDGWPFVQSRPRGPQTKSATMPRNTFFTLTQERQKAARELSRGVKIAPAL